MEDTDIININNLGVKTKKYQPQIIAALERVVSSGWAVLGEEVKNFEYNFARYVDTKYCIGVGNGTDAIELGLRAIGVTAGQTVATVSNAGMFTCNALLAIGATPFFLDVDYDTSNATLSEVQRALESGVDAVVITHLYGLAVPSIQTIAELCTAHNVPLFEDCAQAHGARINNKHVGTFGNAASFSFYPTKNLGALGDGGAVITNSEDTAKKLASLRQYGWTDKYQVGMQGRNSRLDEMQAAVLSVFLPELDKANTRRREIAEYYNANITHEDITLPGHSNTNYVAHLYAVRTPKRQALRQFLQDAGIGTDIHYPVPDYQQAIYEGQFNHLSLPNTDRLAKEIVTLPCYPELTDSEIEIVTSTINRWDE